MAKMLTEKQYVQTNHLSKRPGASSSLIECFEARPLGFP
jgi:hypothetical protein